MFDQPVTGTRAKAGRGGRIRTCDPLLPKQMRYQAALRPDGSGAGDTRFDAGQQAEPATAQRR